MPKLAWSFSNTALAALCVTLAPQAVMAREVAMTCTNPRQEYRVRFDDAKRQFFANDTWYQVYSFTTNPRGTTVSGQTVQDGPRFNAYFGAQKRMEYNSGGEIQTDLCR
ncbi:hypothetical protein [Microvirga arsenatis]|uniref:Uncharacterized protein n=1 Tax=Microvirga arsenatis TaxID=2692265 RepID=A0ABW9Z489_9HYPH|nr:hypothetical protein [Microvirga arsenatis]NBJ13922.1 hypothetical protein [Microvirga arsenatis]NBJ27367.1 hypothetical protein [Microvirga arsenatis]